VECGEDSAECGGIAATRGADTVECGEVN